MISSLGFREFQAEKQCRVFGGSKRLERRQWQASPEPTQISWSFLDLFFRNLHEVPILQFRGFRV